MVPVLPRHLPEEKRRQYTDLVPDGEVIDSPSGESDSQDNASNESDCE